MFDPEPLTAKLTANQPAVTPSMVYFGRRAAGGRPSYASGSSQRAEHASQWLSDRLRERRGPTSG